MFLTIKRSNISDCLTPLIMPSGCPCRGTALPCPDGCREAMPEAPKSHFLKGGLSACKRHPFGLQKTTFCEPKDGLLESPENSPLQRQQSALKNAAMISAEISDGKKQKQHKPRQYLSAAAKCNTAGEKGGSTDEKVRQREKAQKRKKNAAGGKTMRQRSRKTRPPQRHAAHIIYIAHNAPKTANKR